MSANPASTWVPAPTAVDAYREGSQAALEGRQRAANPYNARCHGNSGGRHFYSLRRAYNGTIEEARCLRCGAPKVDPGRDRLRTAWDHGWRDAADSIRRTVPA